MKLKNALILLLVISTATFANAQLKIGYVNIELILAYMPETQTMNQQLQTFQSKLGEKLQVKQQYSQSKYQEYLEKKERNPTLDEATFKEMEEELMKLDEEIKIEAAESEQKLLKKRQELMEPILQKLNANLESLAIEEGYDYILNSHDGNGVSIVLRGPKEHNLTEKVFAKLGIAIPLND
jgi:outer membrane protein